MHYRNIKERQAATCRNLPHLFGANPDHRDMKRFSEIRSNQYIDLRLTRMTIRDPANQRGRSGPCLKQRS